MAVLKDHADVVTQKKVEFVGRINLMPFTEIPETLFLI